MYQFISLAVLAWTATKGLRSLPSPIMPKPSPFEVFMSFLRARHEILRCNQTLALPEAPYAKLSEECASSIIKALVSCKIDTDVDKASIMTEIVAGPMNQQDKMRAIESMNAVVAVADQIPESR